MYHFVTLFTYVTVTSNIILNCTFFNLFPCLLLVHFWPLWKLFAVVALPHSVAKPKFMVWRPFLLGLMFLLLQKIQLIKPQIERWMLNTALNLGLVRKSCVISLSSRQLRTVRRRSEHCPEAKLRTFILIFSVNLCSLDFFYQVIFYLSLWYYQ